LARRNLPSLRALTAFEAAARLGSFRRAADELGITRSAISHQIRALEEELGISLFRRDLRRAELTAPGQAYFPAVREAFDRIETETEALRPDSLDTELTVQVYVTVALKWLIPRLHDFERRFPDMKVRLWTSYFDWEFDEAHVDAAFILARKPAPIHYSRPLFRSFLSPVCAPELLRGPDAIRTPADLARHRLLYVFSAEEDWRIWLRAAGVEGLELSKSLAFDSYILAQEAAVEGRGVAMTIGPFATEELRAGTLVQPFELLVPHRHEWRFMCASGQRLKPKIRRFEQWLAEQVEADPALRPYRHAAAIKEGPIVHDRFASR
jgi:LysR family glycine cleavage system transcriptional activator